MTEQEIELGLAHEDLIVRMDIAKRTDFTPTPTQIERGLTDSDWAVRWAFAERTDYTPTLAHIERGLTDKHSGIRQWFAEGRAAWQAKWEAQELKKRHATVTQAKTKVEAL